MRRSKPLHLRVSLVPEEAPSSTTGPQVGAGLSARSGVSDSPPRALLEKVKGDTSEEGESRVGRPNDNENGGVAEDGGGVVQGPASTQARAQAAQQPDIPTGDDVQSIPWVLDICLDYFTTENPFMAELEEHIGKGDAAVVRDFYEKPTFRGAGTPLPHATQLEHERIFKAEVDRLLRLPSPEKGEASPGDSKSEEGQKSVSASSGLIAVPEENGDYGPGAAARRTPGGSIADAYVAPVRSEEVDDKDSSTLGLQRLAELFDPDGDDRLLVGKFASIVGRIGREGREKVAWTDHCACLPRHLAARDEVESSVRAVEAFLRSLLADGEATTAGGSGGGTGSNISSSVWSGRPGVITVARSEDDGYVPAEMVAFVEREVLAMLNRLYGGNQGVERAGLGCGDLEVCYEEGLEPS
eukprot:g5402.t2